MQDDASKPVKIGITGASGMIGWHLRCHLLQYAEFEVFTCERPIFSNDTDLEKFVSNLDVVVHLAGQNRGDDAEISETNTGLAIQLVRALTSADALPHVIYSSSTHVTTDSVYGQSKKRAGEIIESWAVDKGAKFACLVLPHVFGEGTRPFYNSAVATFAHQLATGDRPEITVDREVELIHAQDVSAIIVDVVRSGFSGTRNVNGHRESISYSLDRLQRMSSAYSAEIIPNVDEKLDLQFFNLYRSYLFPDYYPHGIDMHIDSRGAFVEAVRTYNGGQSSYSTTVPGITRGNHFHLQKIERFLVIEGQARINIRRLFSDKVHQFDVTGDRPAIIDIPTLHTHNIVNSGTEKLVTIFWVNEFFDPKQPDTFAEMV